MINFDDIQAEQIQAVYDKAATMATVVLDWPGHLSITGLIQKHFNASLGEIKVLGINDFGDNLMSIKGVEWSIDPCGEYARFQTGF